MLQHLLARQNARKHCSNHVVAVDQRTMLRLRTSSVDQAHHHDVVVVVVFVLFSIIFNYIFVLMQSVDPTVDGSLLI
jgi:uncharacterized membrane protein YagU involved in acid resistance